MSEEDNDKQTLAPPAGADDVYAAPTLSVHQTNSDIRRLLEAARDEEPPVVQISMPPRRMRRVWVIFVAVALGLAAGALLAWWLLTHHAS